MEPFTLDQAVVAALLFLLGLLLGMYLLAGGKWKRLYTAEAGRVAELERENARLGGEVREYESLRHAAANAPAPVANVAPVTHVEETRVQTTTVTPEPYRRVDTSSDAKPDIVIRRS